MVAIGKVEGSPGDRLRKVALRKGLTVSELGQRAHVGPQTLAKINRGEDVHPRAWARLLKAANDVPDLPLADEVLAG